MTNPRNRVFPICFKLSGGGLRVLPHLLLCAVLCGGMAAPALAAGADQAQSAAIHETLPTPAGGVTNVVERAANSVVEITTETQQVSALAQPYVTESAGSGVILTEDGTLVTNHHVVDGAGAITVRLSGGESYGATLVGTDAKTDLAVLRIEAENLVPAVFAESGSVRVGDLAVAIGNPLGELGGTVTSGIISALDREITIDGHTMTLLQTSAAVNPGNSGGGLFDSAGNLVGIINAKSSGNGIEGLAFAIPADTVKDIVAELLENGYVSGRPQLGVGILEVADAFTAMQYRVEQPGVYVAELHTDSGLEVGDRIVAVEGTPVATSADISAVLEQHGVGDKVLVALMRAGRPAVVRVRLTEQRPAD